MSSKVEYKAGDKILAEGTFGTETFRILSGTVEICKETGKKPLALAELQQGEVFGEMYVFENAGFRSASAVAKTDVTLERISREEIENHLENTPQIIKDILVSLNKRLEGTSQEFSMVSVQRTKWEKILNQNIMLVLVIVLILQVLILFK